MTAHSELVDRLTAVAERAYRQSPGSMTEAMRAGVEATLNDLGSWWWGTTHTNPYDGKPGVGIVPGEAAARRCVRPERGQKVVKSFRINMQTDWTPEP